ncbi:hypothetical protein GW626_03350 [Peribacillus muralis]|uniref:hypothetical protein n=1 Tax=Peribacillus muralis TaxID=264697 RepID=UPI001F4DF6D0|nr:hypothetical protein [Peribacillus muralis]MCK1993887.1 hypothetical protein [Peribacillus muralis]MCK2014442.1 hypothetical protein [Peribacillus muralis]
MKIVIQAFVASFFIHALYISSMMLIGFLKTSQYKPDVVNAWNHAGALQNEVSFGTVVSPSVYAITFLGTGLICAIVIMFYKKPA